MAENVDSGARVQIPALPPATCVFWGTLLNLSVFWFPRMQDRHKKSNYISEGCFED